MPDEAYYPVVQAENGGGLAEVLDPLVDSGGVSRDVTVADYSPESQTLTYSMLELGRVQIRVGLASGPLLYNLVDWKPRPTGEVAGVLGRTKTGEKAR